MTDKRQSPPGRKKPKMNKDVLLFIAFIVFVVLAIGSMMAIDYYGEKHFGNPDKFQDAAER